MGMMIRRNIKKRAAKVTAPSVPKVTVESTEVAEEKKTYKKSDIFRMPVAELQELAKAEGIENAEEKTGAELKTLLVKHLNL